MRYHICNSEIICMCCVALSHACYIEEAASNSKSTLSLTFRSIISKIIRFFASAFACFGSDTAFVLMCIAHRSVCGCVFALYTLCLFVYLKNVFVFGVVYISQNGFSAKKPFFPYFCLFPYCCVLKSVLGMVMECIISCFPLYLVQYLMSSLSFN